MHVKQFIIVLNMIVSVAFIVCLDNNILFVYYVNGHCIDTRFKHNWEY